MAMSHDSHVCLSECDVYARGFWYAFACTVILCISRQQYPPVKKRDRGLRISAIVWVDVARVVKFNTTVNMQFDI